MTGPTADVIDAVLGRSGYCCEVCLEPLAGYRGVDYALHHRRGRDGRPDSHTIPNLMAVHGRDNVTACHGRIHRHGIQSRANGWLITRNGITRDPLLIPILLGERRVYFSADGRYADEPPLVAA